MAKAATRRLKVFQAQFGFYDVVVAAPSRAAALRAWGSRQDLFASGQARETDDPQAVAAARAEPETPLKRAIGSKDAFAVEAARLPDVPAAAKRALAKPKRHVEPAQAKPADRTRLDAAEAALRTLDEARQREEAEFRARETELEAARSGAQAAYVDNRKKATAAVASARDAYREAGGNA